MKVRCNICEHNRNGFCARNKKNGNLVRINVNKPRSCDLYKEDATKVLEQYRKQEAHKTKLRRLKLRQAQIQQATEQINKDLTVKQEGLITSEEV